MLPVLIFGYGNPGRGDDAIGPLLVERLETLNLRHVELLTDFQLQVEHALDVRGREKVIFVDACVSCPAPFELSRLQPRRDASYTSHAVSPAAVLHACLELYGAAPESWMLAVRGESFALGAALSAAARVNLEAALEALVNFCANPAHLSRCVMSS